MWLQPVGSCAGRPAGPQQVRVSDLDRDMAVLLLRGCLLVQVLFFAEMCPFGWTVENLLISRHCGDCTIFIVGLFTGGAGPHFLLLC